jgi:hypothetical protein
MDKPKRYRMKPKTVEAIRFTGYNGLAVCAWLKDLDAVQRTVGGEIFIEWFVPDGQDEYGNALTQRVMEGYWIVRRLKDKHTFIVSQWAFEESYALDTQSY